MSQQDDDKKQTGKEDDVPSVGRESFPHILHAMLDEIGTQGLSHIVSWQPHGRCFVVHKRKTFVECVMPVYFRMSKFVSFQRQLNLYGFNRITKGQDKGGYYHELFLRSRRDLCKNIRRRQIKGTGTRKPDTPEAEPNFYLMEFLPDSSADLDKKMPTTGVQSGNNTATSATLDPPISLTGMLMPSAAITPRPSIVSSMESSSSSSWYPGLSLAGTSSSSGINAPMQHQPTSTSNVNIGPLIAALHAAGATTPQGVILREALANLTSNQPLTSPSLVDAATASLSNFSASPLAAFQGRAVASTPLMPGPASLLAAATAFQTMNMDILRAVAALPHLAGEQRTPCGPGQSRLSQLDAFATALQYGIRDSVINTALNGNTAAATHNSSSSTNSLDEST